MRQHIIDKLRYKPEDYDFNYEDLDIQTAAEIKLEELVSELNLEQMLSKSEDKIEYNYEITS